MHDCDNMAFIINAKIMGSLLLVLKILWCFPDMSFSVYLPTSSLQGPVTFQHLNKCSQNNMYNLSNMTHCMLLHSGKMSPGYLAQEI